MAKKNALPKKSVWKLFGVKILYESIITGKPKAGSIDKDYSDNTKTFEESIIVIRAQSDKQAWKLARSIVKENEIHYKNPYGQNVQWRFVDIIDTFHLFEDEVTSGSEVYSRYVTLPKKMTTKNVIKQLYPDIF